MMMCEKVGGAAKAERAKANHSSRTTAANFMTTFLSAPKRRLVRGDWMEGVLARAQEGRGAT
jgi:hypothetical protein